MAKQNELSLSALNRARLRRQRSSVESSEAPEDPSRDVIVPSFLWEPPQEKEAAAASWKEEPLPVRRPRVHEAREDEGDMPSSLPGRDGEDGDVPEEDASLPYGGRAYVFASRSGRKTMERADETEYSRSGAASAAGAAFPGSEAERDDRRDGDAGHGDGGADEREFVPYVREMPDAADAAGSGEFRVEEDAATVSGEEDLRELEAALAARGIMLPRRKETDRRATARALPDERIFPEDGREASGVEDVPEAAPVRVEDPRERHSEAGVGESAFPAAPPAASRDGNAEESPGMPEDAVVEEVGTPAPSPDEQSGPADFAATPDAFLTMMPEASGAQADAGSAGSAPVEAAPETGPAEPPSVPEAPGAAVGWLRRFLLMLALLAVVCLGLLLPYSFWWVHADGDVAVERAVAMQAGGKFAIFGSGVSQDFVDYKLRLYAAVKPEIVVVGSSRVMQFRGSYFRRPFVNVGGTAGNLSVLRSTIDAMLKIHRPQVVIIGLDFWWFSANWQKDPFAPEPPTSGSYVYDLETLKAPWKWLLEGKIGWKEFFAPLTGGFREDRFGIMAQRGDDGFASDGSWHYTTDVTGRQRPFDYQFGDTLKQVRYGIKAFAPAPVLSEAHLDAFAEIYCRLKSRGIQTYVFIAPLSATVLDAMRERQKSYPHLFSLYTALMERGIDVMDFTDPRKFGSSDCEFVDGFHGGEVTYTRILRDLVDRYHALVAYVDVERINRVLKEWKGHATVYDERVTTLPEVDFMNLSCPKKQR